jgi:hypothetical protein
MTNHYSIQTTIGDGKYTFFTIHYKIKLFDLYSMSNKYPILKHYTVSHTENMYMYHTKQIFKLNV